MRIGMIRVLLADDHHIVREGLRALIEKQSDMEVVAEAENGRQALRLALELKPDVIVMDITMPDLNGIEVTRRIADEAPQVRVIALSMHSDRNFVNGMLRAGGSGYLLKDCASEELIESIRAVKSGRIYLSPAVTPMRVSEFVQLTRDVVLTANSALSVREREVLQKIAEGRSTRETADLLCISVKTVETHRKNIMEKLDLHTVPDLTKYAIRNGLISAES